MVITEVTDKKKVDAYIYTVIYFIASGLFSDAFNWYDYIKSSFGGLVISMLASGTFGGLVVSMLASGTHVRGFKPGQSRWIFWAKKILRMPSFGGEVKPLVPCRSFVACKRTLHLP
jgi:hypothetical protein